MFWKYTTHLRENTLTEVWTEVWLKKRCKVIFEIVFLQEKAWALFYNPVKQYTWAEGDRFWPLFHLWWPFYSSLISYVNRSTHNKQPLNLIKLIQVGKIRGCFVDLKCFISISKLIQSLNWVESQGQVAK